MNATDWKVTDDYGREVDLSPDVARFADVAAVKRANDAAGFHFFEPASMRFFDSRFVKCSFFIRGVPVVRTGHLYHRCMFITSERFHGSDGFHGPRLYTIRVAHPDGSIGTV